MSTGRRTATAEESTRMNVPYLELDRSWASARPAEAGRMLYPLERSGAVKTGGLLAAPPLLLATPTPGCSVGTTRRGFTRVPSPSDFSGRVGAP